MDQREEFFYFRAGIPVDKMTHMVGSYAPKEDVHSYQTPIEDVRQKSLWPIFTEIFSGSLRDAEERNLHCPVPVHG